MIIRNEQMQALERAQQQRFENRMLAHVRKFFPEVCADDQRARSLLKRGIERARFYGFRTERDICLYLNFHFCYGPEADKELPWAAAILDDSLSLNPSARADWLQQAGEEHLPD
jgi:hypothetical protein